MADPQWLAWANRIRAIARAGLTYSDNPFEIERCEQLQELAAEILAEHTDADMETVQGLIGRESGYPTPKVDVRGVVFKDDAILLVQETMDDGRWTLPGGWADIWDTPSQAVEREVFEESGFRTKAVKLLAVLDRNKQGHPPHPDSIYKLFFLCEIISGEATASIETSGAAFFCEDEIPELSISRILPGQIARLFEHHRNAALPADFD